MGIISDGIKKDVETAIKWWYSIKERQAEADSLAAANKFSYRGSDVDQKEAFQHTLVAATLAYDKGESTARYWGYAKEMRVSGVHDKPGDNYRDMYNNELGIQIARFVKE